MSQRLSVSAAIAKVWNEYGPCGEHELSVSGELTVGAFDSLLTDCEKSDRHILVRGGWLFGALSDKLEPLFGGPISGIATITGVAVRQSPLPNLPVAIHHIHSFEFERRRIATDGSTTIERVAKQTPVSQTAAIELIYEDIDHVIFRKPNDREKIMAGLPLAELAQDFRSLRKLAKQLEAQPTTPKYRLKSKIEHMHAKLDQLLERARRATDLA